MLIWASGRLQWMHNMSINNKKNGNPQRYCFSHVCNTFASSRCHYKLNITDFCFVFVAAVAVTFVSLMLYFSHVCMAVWWFFLLLLEHFFIRFFTSFLLYAFVLNACVRLGARNARCTDTTTSSVGLFQIEVYRSFLFTAACRRKRNSCVCASVSVCITRKTRLISYLSAEAIVYMGSCDAHPMHLYEMKLFVLWPHWAERFFCFSFLFFFFILLAKTHAHAHRTHSARFQI